MANSLTSDGVISTGTPAFAAKPASNQSSPGTGATVVWGTEQFDQGNDFASNTFTAPVTGKYVFLVYYRMNQVDADSNYSYFNIMTSNRSYEMSLENDVVGGTDSSYVSKFGHVITDMDASDTCYIQYIFSAGVTCGSISTCSWFSGYLAC